MKNPTTVARKSDREIVITRLFDAPPPVVFKAWTSPDLLQKWWAPKSSGMMLAACILDARTGGAYRFEFAEPGGEPAVFFGKYLEVTPGQRLVWTNEEGAEGAITTVTFEAKGAKTLLTLTETYPSKQALDRAVEGMEGAMPEQFEQLDELLTKLR